MLGLALSSHQLLASQMLMLVIPYSITMPWGSGSFVREIVLFSIRTNDLQCGQSSIQYVLDKLTESTSNLDEFFLIATLPINLVYIGIFFTVELAFGLVAASYFAAADGHLAASIALKKSGGAFGFISGILGYYTLGHLMCQEALFFSFPLGDTSRLFRKQKKG